MSVSEQVLQYLKEDFDDVYEAGAKSEYDRFWDTFQVNGTRGNYTNCFISKYWTPETFCPKYDLKPTDGGAYAMFQNCNMEIDLQAHLESCGVCLDTSGVTSPEINYIFAGSHFTRIGKIDLSGIPKGSSIAQVFFQTKKLVTIDEIVLPEEAQFLKWFIYYCNELQNLKITGVIENPLTIQWSSKLTVESAKNVLSCLKDLTGTEKHGVNTITLHNDVWSRLDADGNTAPNGKTWREYVYDLGWVA